MQDSNIRTDDSLLSRADQVLGKLENLLNTLAGFVVLAVMLLSVVNILGRKLFSYPVPGFLDIMVLAVPVMAFLGLGNCQRLGGHIRMDLIVGNLKGRKLWATEMLALVVMLFIVGVLIYGSWDHAARALQNGDSTPVAYLPTWQVKALVSASLGLLFIRLAMQFWAFARAFRTGAPDPVAVPLIEDAAAIAAREAEAMTRKDINE